MRLGPTGDTPSSQFMCSRPGEKLERVMGIEPTLVAWEATVLPLNYTRNVGDSRQERQGQQIYGLAPAVD